MKKFWIWICRIVAIITLDVAVNGTMNGDIFMAICASVLALVFVYMAAHLSAK